MNSRTASTETTVRGWMYWWGLTPHLILLSNELNFNRSLRQRRSQNLKLFNKTFDWALIKVSLSANFFWWYFLPRVLLSLLLTLNITHIQHAIPAGIYLLKANNRNTRSRCEICSKLTLKTPERRHWCRSIVNFEHVIAGW